MTGTTAFRKSLADASSNLKLVILLYLCSLLLAFPVAFLAHSITTIAFGNSLAADALLPGFDYTVIHDLLSHHGEALRTIIRLCFPVVFLGVFANIFLAGGTLSLLVRDHSFALGTFFGSCGAYFGRFVRLWLIFAAIGLAVFAILNIPLALVSAALSDKAESEQVVVLGTIAAAALIFSPMLVVLLAADYARVSMIVHEAGSVWMAVGRGFSFVLNNLWAVLMLHFLLLLVLGLATAAYLVLEGFVGMTSFITILAVFLLQQLFIAIRLWNRVTFFAGEVILYTGRRPRPIVFYGWDDSPRTEII
jgi:hypothetical protein